MIRTATKWPTVTLAAAVATAIACPSAAQTPQETGAANAGSREVSTHGALTLNEISPGPALSYIEVFNGTAQPVSLEGYSLESATGTFDLDGLAGALASGQHFVLIQGHVTEVGPSTDASVPCIIVSEPTCGHVSDTVLLRDPFGDVVDAIAYGIAVDTSPRYQEALNAGQLEGGSFVSVADRFDELVLGRDGQGQDTDRVEDWATGGGKDALVASPFGPNTARPDGPESWIPFFQAHLTSVLTQEHYGITVVTGDFGNYAETGDGSSCSHSLTLAGELLGTGEHVLSGPVANVLSPAPGGGFTVSSEGTLSDGADLSIAFRVERSLDGPVDRTAWIADLTVGDESYPYELVLDRTRSGVRGNFLLEFTRSVSQWTGSHKVTAGTQSVEWLLTPEGTIGENVSSTTFSRPWPMSDGRAGSAIVPEVITTQTVHMDAVARTTESGPVVEWPRLEFEYANDIPTIVGTGFHLEVESSDPPGLHVESRLAGDLVAESVSMPFESTSRLEYSASNKLYTWTKSGSIDSKPFPTFSGTFDPPSPSAVGFWSGLKSLVRGTAKVMGTIATVATAAVACASTTAAATAAGGSVTMATLGTATPAAVGLAAGGAIVCQGLVVGSGAVIKKIWAKK